MSLSANGRQLDPQSRNASPTLARDAKNADVALIEERLIRNQKVTGASPVIGSKKSVPL